MSRYGIAYYPPLHLTVLNVGGQQTLESVNEIEEIVSDYFWISTKDLLVVEVEEVTSRDEGREVEIRLRKYYVINASTDEILQIIDIKVTVPKDEVYDPWYSQEVDITWLEAADQLVFAYVEPLSRILWLKIFNLDGKVSSRTFRMPQNQVFNFHVFSEGLLLIPALEVEPHYKLIDLLDGTTHTFLLEALYRVYQADDLQTAILVDAIDEDSDTIPFVWSRGSFYLLDMNDGSTKFIGIFPLGTDVHWSNDGTMIIFTQLPLVNIYDVQQDRFHTRPLYFDSRRQLGIPVQLRFHEDTNEVVLLNSERRDDDNWQDILYLYDLGTETLKEYANLPVYGFLDAVSPDLNFYLDFQYGNNGKPLIIRSLDNDSQVAFPLAPRNHGIDLIAFLDWHEAEHWLIIHEAFKGGGGSPFTRWSSIANMDGEKRDLTSCTSCVIWLPDHVDIDKLPEGQTTSVLPSITPHITLNGSGKILWHEDYISVDGVVYGINTGDIISVSEDITFSASEDADPTFDGLPFRVEEMWDTVMMMVLIDQSVGDIVGRYIYLDSYWDKGKLIESRNIFIQPTDLSDGVLVIWDMENGEIIANLPIPALEVFISPDEEYVALQMAHNKVQVWSVDELLELGLVVPPREVPLDYEFYDENYVP